MTNATPEISRPKLTRAQADEAEAREARKQERLLRRLETLDRERALNRLRYVTRWAARQEHSTLARRFGILFIALSDKRLISTLENADRKRINSILDSLKAQSDYFLALVVDTKLKRKLGGKLAHSRTAAAMQRAKKLHREWREGKHARHTDKTLAAKIVSESKGALKSPDHLRKTKFPEWDREHGTPMYKRGGKR